MKRVKQISIGVAVILIAAQLIQPTQNRDGRILPSDITKTINVPENVQHLLSATCYDCHSNNTRYPWYSRLQPFGWMLANHINEGKAELNFNEFGSYSLRRQMSKLNGIAGSLKDGTMPLASYTFIHRDARLSKEDKTLIMQWALKEKDSLDMNR